MGDRGVPKPREALMRWRRPLVLALSLSLLTQALAMAPINAATPSSEQTVLPDPASRPPVPPELLSSQPQESAGGGENHVRKLSPSEVSDLEESGATVIVNEEGLLEFDVGDSGQRTRLALYDTETVSGIPVVGFGFLNESEIQSLEARSDVGGFAFGPQPVLADNRSYNHTHPLGSPFHSCSYLYQYAGNSRDAYVYICPIDVGNIRAIGSIWAAIVLVPVGSPLLSLLGVLVWNVGISLFQENDGSLQLYVPGSSSVNHYGYSYYYSRYTYWEDWYYHNPSWSPYYCYATKYRNGYRYYECY